MRERASKLKPAGMILLLLVGVGAGSAHAQDHPARSSGTQDEVIVEGQPLPRDKPVVEVKPQTSMATGNRRLADHAEVFARCVKEPNLTLLRRIIDGPRNSSNMRGALDLMIRTNRVCYPSFPQSPYMPPALGNCNPAAVAPYASRAGMDGGNTNQGDPRIENALMVEKRCRSLFDFGALLTKAMERYAPGLTLTASQTQNQTVALRFLEREKPRSRYRNREDLYYFAVASCMVQRQPELAMRLYRAPHGSADESALRQALIDRTRDCTGNAKEVLVDPSEFRVYVTDAIYRWAVAVKGTDSLLPPA